MNDLNDASNPNQNQKALTQNARQITWALLGTSLVAFVVYLFLALQLGVWQVMMAAASIGIYMVLNLISLYLLRRERRNLAMFLIIGGVCVVMPFISIFVAEIGVSLGVGLILINFLAAIQTLPPKYFSPVLFISLFFGMITIFIDVLNLSPVERLAVPDLELFMPFIITLSVLVIGFFVVRQFKTITYVSNL